MGASLLYEVLPPPRDAHSALRRARTLLSEFASNARGPWVQLGPVVTVEQFRQARDYFTRGSFWTKNADFRARLAQLGVMCDENDHRIQVELTFELEALWPLPEDIELDDLHVGPGEPRPSWLTSPDDPCDESVLDITVAHIGPLALHAYWYAPLRGLPAPKLCGVQLCLNSTWSMQDGAETAQGSHSVYFSAGTKNTQADREQWLAATGLRFGEALDGW